MKYIYVIICLMTLLANDVLAEILASDEHQIVLCDHGGEEGETENDTKESGEEEVDKRTAEHCTIYCSSLFDETAASISLFQKEFKSYKSEVASPPPERS